MAAVALSGVTPQQAERALAQGVYVTSSTQVQCTPEGRTEICRAMDSTTYTDATFGPARIVGTTVFRVSRHGTDYEVRIVVPDHFEIYGAPN